MDYTDCGYTRTTQLQTNVRVVTDRHKTVDFLSKYFPSLTSKEFYNWVRFARKGSTLTLDHTLYDPNHTDQIWVMAAD